MSRRTPCVLPAWHQRRPRHATRSSGAFSGVGGERGRHGLIPPDSVVLVVVRSASGRSTGRVDEVREVGYQMPVHTAPLIGEHDLAVFHLLGGRALAEEAARCGAPELIERGLEAQTLEALARASTLPLAACLEVVGLSVRTLRRRLRTRQRLSAMHSDRLYRMARIVVRAQAVLTDPAAAKDWLLRPNRALGARAPLALLRTDPGTEVVEDVLGRIEDGVYS